ncbi:GTPase-activating protein [Plakobranchus ocellatus]|uniref:GTPase-activating protein n=1 Tax=Plakobranchus ocellatus TaxID=259542 RepID=A0AAV4DT69_9GAST|nr:GTPase-activating protein [Plakobranchus ocellatus]
MATDAGRTTMFNVQNIYGTPQISRRRQGQGLSKPRRMTLIDLRSVPLTDEDGKNERKGSSSTIKSESGVAHLHSHKPASEISQPTSPARRPSGSVSSSSNVTGGGSGGMKVKHSAISPPLVGGGAGMTGGGLGGVAGDHTRFPKLEEYAHFHYDLVEIPSLSVSICSEDASGCKHSADNAEDSTIFFVTVRGSAPKPWLIRRTLENFVTLDKQLHKCIFDRRFSHLEDIKAAELEAKPKQTQRQSLVGIIVLPGLALNRLGMSFHSPSVRQ